MKEQNITRIQKSTFWSIGHIILHLLGYLIVFDIIYRIINFLFGMILPILIIHWIIILLAVFIGVNTAFKFIIKQSFVALENLTKIAFGVVIIPVIFQILFISYSYLTVNSFVPNLLDIVQFIIWDIVLFVIVYYSGRRFVDK